MQWKRFRGTAAAWAIKGAASAAGGMMCAALMGSAHAQGQEFVSGFLAKEGPQHEVIQGLWSHANRVPSHESQPSWRGLVAVAPQPGIPAPPGEHLQTVAYRLPSGCSVFFPANEAGQREVTMQWSGAACKGRLQTGEGTLVAQRLEGDQRVVRVYQGRFRDGMLDGQAAKATYIFDAGSGSPNEAYHFEGSFGNSVLNGEGSRSHSRRVDGRAVVVKVNGNFRDGVESGLATYSFLNPWPGALALVQRLRVDSAGNIIATQRVPNVKGTGHVTQEGVLYTEGPRGEADPMVWRIQVREWGDGQPTSASLVWNGYLSGKLANGEENYQLEAMCKRWRFQPDGLQCADGTAGSGNDDELLLLPGGSFRIPYALSTSPLKFVPGPSVALEYRLGRRTVTLRCGDGGQRCTGTGRWALPGAFLFEIEGDLVWLAREGLRARSGTLYALDVKSGERKQLASCDGFAYPTASTSIYSEAGTTIRCPEGRGRAMLNLRNEEGYFAGGWDLKGLVLDGREGRMTPGGIEVVREGDGKVVIGTRSAHVRYRHGELTAVDEDCEIDGAVARCVLQGNGVAFHRIREDRQREASPPARYQPPQPQFVPPPPRPQLPQRREYVLPGMR